MVLPKNVFTTCPKANGKVMTTTIEHKILLSSGTVLMNVKDRRISLADIRKAAKCAKMTTFNVRRVTSPASKVNLEARDFPVSFDVVIMKPDVSASVTPRMVITPKFKIFKVVDGTITLVQVVENFITLSNLEKAATCARFKRYTVHSNSTTSIELFTNTSSKITQDVYIRNVIKASTSTLRGVIYKIIKASDGSLLLMVQDSITLSHLERAAKCAGFKNYSVYVNQKRVIVNLLTKINHDVELRKATPSVSKKKSTPHVFHVCDQTDAKKSTKKVKMSKKQLLNKAIDALTELRETI